MTMRQFIKANQATIDAVINDAQNFIPRTASCYCHESGTDHRHRDRPSLNFEERRQWVLNDEGLYRWARSQGVRI